ncbi:hypothetical protein [Pseudomonas sp. S1(2024)]|uniref:hypothetical protein n=1 Tax=Pseudomonas sp. S1(2024) TaxID=3390191 RepID=UPI00397D775B
MGDSFWGSPWLWGLIGVGAGLAIGAKFMGPDVPVNPVVEINELRSDWTIECIKRATPQNYPTPPEAINNCTEQSLKVIPLNQAIPSVAGTPPDNTHSGDTDRQF